MHPASPRNLPAQTPKKHDRVKAYVCLVWVREGSQDDARPSEARAVTRLSKRVAGQKSRSDRQTGKGEKGGEEGERREQEREREKESARRGSGRKEEKKNSLYSRAMGDIMRASQAHRRPRLLSRPDEYRIILHLTSSCHATPH